MSAKADSRLAEFLRRVLAAGDDAAPVEIIFGPETTTGAVQRSVAQEFVATVREMGYIEPSGGPDADPERVRVTPQGREWLAGYDGRSPALHPRFSS